jgi:hypothetical protein
MKHDKDYLGRFLIAGLICLFVGINLAVASLIDANEECVFGVVVGICVGQVNLIALWAALASGNVLVRLPWSLLLGVAMWYSLVFGARLTGNFAFLPGDATLLGAILLVGIVCAQIPLWIAGKVFCWKLLRGPLTFESRQFSLRQLLAGMFLLSAALAAGRIVLPDGSRWDSFMEYELWVLVAALIVSNLVITLPCIWGSFARLRWLLLLSLAWLVYCAVLTAIEFGALCALLGSPGRDWYETALAFYLINVAQCGTVFSVLLLLRSVGFRFVRVPLQPIRETAV